MLRDKSIIIFSLLMGTLEEAPVGGQAELQLLLQTDMLHQGAESDGHEVRAVYEYARGQHD